MKNTVIKIFFITIVFLTLISSSATIAQVSGKIRNCSALQNTPDLRQLERLVAMPQFIIPGYWTIKILGLFNIWNPLLIEDYISSSILGFHSLLHDDKKRACNLANKLREQVTSALGKSGGLYFLQYFIDQTKYNPLILDRL